MTTTCWEDGDGHRLVRVAGELDHEGCEEIAEAFAQATAGGPGEVVVDLSGVTFVSSQGIWMMLQTYRQLGAQGRNLQVRGMRPHIYKVFETVGVFRAIPEWQTGER
ncbi:MAG: STAS domain-containing protein [Planctomycetota bacterium]